MSTHATPLLDRKVLLALVPLASLTASHEGNPNAHGPVNFSEIAQSIAAATISTQPASAIETSSSSHSTHLTPSLLHGIIPNITTSTSTSTDTDPLVIIPVTGTVTDLVNYDTYTIPASLPPIPPPSAGGSSPSTTTTSGADRTRTVWATVVKQTQVVTVVKTLTPEHKASATGTSSTTASQSWPKGECTGKGDVAVNGKCVPKTLVTSTTRGTKSSTSASSSVSFTISSTSSSNSSPTSTISRTTSSTTTSIPITTRSSTSTSTSTDTDPLVIIPVTGTVTDLINYDTYTIPASLPALPTLTVSSASASSKSSTRSSTSDDGPLEIIPVTGTVTDLVDYDTVTVPSQTTVVVIPVSTSSTKSQNMGQMLGHIQGMGQSSRVVVHPTVSLGDRLTVVSGSDGSTTITRASPTASTGEGGKGEFCKEKE